MNFEIAEQNIILMKVQQLFFLWCKYVKYW